MNIRIDLDGAVFKARWTHAEPDGESVFATLEEAKARALTPAIAEREAWAQCVRDIRSFALDEVDPAWDDPI